MTLIERSKTYDYLGLFYPLVAVGGTFLYLLHLQKHRTRLPPGPKGWFFIGNALQIAQHTPWLTLSDWKKKYGDIVYLNLFGRPIVVINSIKIAKDLLEKRASIYSDRPMMQMLSLAGFDRNFALMPYCEEFRQQRKLIAQDFTPSKCPQYFTLLQHEASALVLNIQQNPGCLLSEIKLRIGNIIFRATYGYTVASEEDPFFKMGLKSLDDFVVATTAVNSIVDLVPWLKYVPSYFPGARFQHTAKEMTERFDRATADIMWHCRDGRAPGNSLVPSVCGNYYNAARGQISRKEEEQLRWAAFGVLGGGQDTIMNSVVAFFIAMILNPQIQKKAQAELDTIAGKRLPLISDKSDLPYIRSIMTEVYRWAPVLPAAECATMKRPWFTWLNGGTVSIPHAPNRDDEYGGIFIAKGSIILPNTWLMLHDPDAYPKPMDFIPERYQDCHSEMDRVKDVVFGFGKRACPGMHFAESAFFSIVATTLATCDVLPGLDEHGRDVLPEYDSTGGTVSFPGPFTMRLSLRYPQALSVLSESSAQAE